MPTEHCFQRNALQGEVCYFCAENELKIRLNDFVKKCRLHRGVCPVELHFLFEVNRLYGQRTRMLKLTLHFYSICLLCSGDEG